MVLTCMGREQEIAQLGEVERGVYSLESFSDRDVAEAMRIIERYADLDLGLADASSVVLANRYGARDVLTLEERHFGVLRGVRDRPLRPLPADLP